MDKVVFTNLHVDNAAQKPFNPENWNEFVRALKASTINLPACYAWVKEESLVEKEFCVAFVNDIVLYLAENDNSIANKIKPLLVAMVSGLILAKLPISFVIKKCFMLKTPLIWYSVSIK